MTEVREHCELGSSVAEVWGLVGDFRGFVEMLVAPRGGTVRTDGDGVGMTRTVIVGHDRMVERLEELDETNWRVRYSMLETGPLRIVDYQAVIALTALGANRSAVAWVGSFAPDGASEREADVAVRSIYIEGLTLMRARFGP